MQQSFSDHPKLVSAVFIQVLELQALEAGNNNNGNNEQEEEVDESYRGTHFCNR